MKNFAFLDKGVSLGLGVLVSEGEDVPVILTFVLRSHIQTMK